MLEVHLLDVMYLARNSNITYSEAMSWPRWKVQSRCQHIEFWIDREDKATEAAQMGRRR